MKKDKLIITIIILSVLAVIASFVGFCFWLFGGQPKTTQAGLSYSEISFLVSNGFLESENAENSISGLKPLALIEQNLNSDKESFNVLATKLNKDNYQMAFKLENKGGQDKEFYLIPVSKESQLQFKEIKGIVDDKKTIAISKEDVSKEPLEQLYDAEKHKKELSPELAKAYEDIKGSGYSAKPIKIVLPPRSTLLANSVWEVNGSLKPKSSTAGLKPVYFLVYGSAGGAKDDLVILNVHSSPQRGENWEVSFTTKGTADLKIIPNDQATIDDDEFVSLSCDNEKRTPQILKGDVIYYSNWECSGIGKVIHYTKQAGKHTLRFEFNGQTAFAYNGWLSGWLHRKAITIDNAYVDSSLTDFPAYIKINADVQIGDGAQNDGDDIRFTSSDGSTLLKYEEESWSGGAGTDATANYWVKVPTIATATDTIIYIYYGKSDATDGQDAINVWDTNYKGVWHLKEDPSGSSPQAQDSTSNNKDGVSNGSMTSGDLVAAKIDNAWDFDGTDDYEGIASLSQPINMSFSAWVKASATPAVYDSIAGNSLSNWSAGWGFYYDSVNLQFWVEGYGANSAYKAYTTPTSWHHIVGTFSGTTVNIYIDGVAGTSDSFTGSISDQSALRIGSTVGSAARNFPGIIDEPRISDIARPAEWIKFEYRNVAESDNEISFSNQESITFFDQGWLYRRKITIDHTYVDGDLTDFPLYVYLNPSGAGSGLGSKIKDDGYDIRFMSADGSTALSYERENYSEASGNSTGYFWVKVPVVAGASNTEIYMYYGKSDATDGQDTVNTWNSNFSGVWHLAEAATDEGTAASLYQDSTSSNNDGTQAGPDDVAGKVYNGQDFDGTNDYIDFGDKNAFSFGNGTTDSPFTISTWVNPDTLNANTIAEKYQAGGYEYIFGFTVTRLYAWVYDNSASAYRGRYVNTVNNYITVGQWAHVTFVYNGGGANSSTKIYINGVQRDDTDMTGGTYTAMENLAKPLTIGKTNNGFGDYAEGVIDDFRVSSIARPAEWIKFEYYNINEADNELIWGDEGISAFSLRVKGGLKVKGGFKIKGNPTAAFVCGDTLTDTRDSKTYATVLLGSQCWMRENMNIGTLTAGANTQGTDCPSASAIEKYCYDDNEANCTTYGGLYRWSQAMCGSTTAGAAGICPTGWHIPTHDEYTTLERAVCTSGSCATDFPYDTTTIMYRGTNEGTTLKTVNSSSFSGLLPGDCRIGVFYGITVYTALWSSLQSSGGYAWARYLDSGYVTVGRGTNDKTFGFSIRCVKD